MTINYDNGLGMCQQPNPIPSFDEINNIKLMGFQPNGAMNPWQYSLSVSMNNGSAFKAFVTIDNSVNIEPIQGSQLNILAMNITIDLRDVGQGSAFPFQLGDANYESCCPASSPPGTLVCNNCDQLPRGQCNMVNPNKTPIQLDLNITIKKNGAHVTTKRIPYDKARHDGGKIPKH